MTLSLKSPPLLFLLVFIMGNSQSPWPRTPHLNVFLNTWRLRCLLTLNLNVGSFTLQCKLGDQEVGLKDGSFNNNTILQLDLCCRCPGKWSEIPYYQTFFFLRTLNFKPLVAFLFSPLLLSLPPFLPTLKTLHYHQTHPTLWCVGCVWLVLPVAYACLKDKAMHV